MNDSNNNDNNNGYETGYGYQEKEIVCDGCGFYGAISLMKKHKSGKAFCSDCHFKLVI